MKVTTINFEQISDIIDEAVENNKPFAITCYGDLAQDIKSYMSEMHEIEDTCDYEIDEDEEYYVSSLSAEQGDDYMFFVEPVFTDDLVIKKFEADCEMMIFTDLDLEDVEENIKARSIGYYEFESDDSCDCEECSCGCCDYKDISDEITAEAEFISDALNEIILTDGCPNCISKVLVKFYFDSKNIGETNAKDYMRKCIEG